MDTETQWVYDRITLDQLRLAQPHWTAPQLAEAIGRSERWARKWLQRLRTSELTDLKRYVSQSRAPKSRPRQTPPEIKEIVCELRETLSEKYHRPAGPRLILAYLLKDTRLQASDFFIPTSSRTLSQILRERGYILPRRKVEHLPLPLCAPMEEWEMDFCEITLEDGRFEFFLVVDRGTSRVVYLEGCPGYRADSALLAVYRLLASCGLPARLRFDRDPRLVWSWSVDSYPAPLVRLLYVLGIEPMICPPRRPDKKPYVERCVRTFKQEWLDRFSLNSLADCYEALAAFPHYHNAQRVHLGRTCRGRTPDEAFPVLPTLPQLPPQVQPNRWLEAQHERVFRRRIRTNGSVQIDKHLYYVDEKLAKHTVLIQLDAYARCFRVMLEGELLPRVLPLKGLYDEQLELHDYLRLLQQEAVSITAYRQQVWMRSGEVA
jgi:hypothetical protein